MELTRITPTDEQIEAMRLFTTGESMVLDALAGTGKTSTLRLLAWGTRRRGRYVAYNKAIVQDVQSALPERCPASTAHSLAFRAVGTRYAHRLRQPRIKQWEVANRLDIVPLYVSAGLPKEKRLSPGWLAGHVMRAIANFTNSKDPEPALHHFPYADGIDLPDPDDGRRTFVNNRYINGELEGALRKAWQDLTNEHGALRFRHDDYLKIWALGDPRIEADYILLDEAQDTNPVLAGVIERQTHAQRVLVGDENQQLYCQPPGTMVTVPSGGRTFVERRVPIESLRVGDLVVTYHNGHAYKRGRPIAAIRAIDHDGPLVTVTTEQGASSYTPHHQCIVRMGPTLRGQHAVYMMRRGEQYRIGRCPLFYASQGQQFGLAMRATAEGADAAWVLSVHESAADAALAEAVAAHEFGVPDVCFSRTANHLLDVDAFWRKIGTNRTDADACLAAFGRLIEFPLWERGGALVGNRRPFVTAAANLLSGMRVLPIGGDMQHPGKRGYVTPAHRWTDAAVSRSWYSGPVVSIEVAEHHTYYADGILTHNSWRGAVDAMAGFPDENRRSLTQTFRFGASIAWEANALLEELDAPLRIVPSPDVDSYVGRYGAPVDAVLCRTNARALQTVIDAQMRGQPVHLTGGGTEVASFARAVRDLQKEGRTSHHDLACFDTWQEVLDYVREERDSEMALMVRLIEEFGTEAILRAVDGTTPEGPGVLTVSTGHKAKGRQWNAVRIAEDFVDRDPTVPELRLRYVAFTRARLVLDQSVFRDDPRAVLHAEPTAV